MYQSFLIHSSADGHVGCFHVLAIINSAAMNIGVHVGRQKYKLQEDMKNFITARMKTYKLEKKRGYEIKRIE